jgi:hypothetical protein
MDPGVVVCFRSFGPGAAFAVPLDLSAHVLVAAFSLPVVFLGENVGVVGVDLLLGDAEFEWGLLAGDPEVGSALGVRSCAWHEDAVAELAAMETWTGGEELE